MLPPTGADETRGRHLGGVNRSTQCNPFGWSNELSAHLINHTSLNTTDFHAFFVIRVAMIKATWFGVFYYKFIIFNII